MKAKTRKGSVIKSLIGIVLLLALSYVLSGLFLTLEDLLHMVGQNKASRNTELGEARYEELKASGIPESYDIYTEDEIAANSDLAVVKLYYFPCDGGETTNYAIVLPGGGYYECDIYKVGLPCAATLNETGYSAFVLGYRYGKYSSAYAPIEDLARAVKYITENADEFNVNTENYTIFGFSAGGNLAGLFASKDLGYAKYDLPAPATLSLAYPWININGKIELTGNCWQEAVTGVSQLIGNKFLLGKFFPDEESKAGVCVQNHVDADYPPTYIMQGDNDFVVPHKSNSDVMVEALAAAGVTYRYNLCEGVNHGCGLGIGTTAEGWVEEAVSFWRNTVEGK